MTVETLCVGYKRCKFMFGGIALFGSINGLVASLVAAIITIKHVTCSAARCPVKPSAPRTGRVDMAPEAASPQEVIHQHSGHLRMAPFPPAGLSCHPEVSRITGHGEMRPFFIKGIGVPHVTGMTSEC